MQSENHLLKQSDIIYIKIGLHIGIVITKLQRGPDLMRQCVCMAARQQKNSGKNTTVIGRQRQNEPVPDKMRRDKMSQSIHL